MIVLVVGMHRSGTSALAGMLHSNGVIMGREDKWHPPPMRENPKGFYENRDFRMINDQILREHGYKVKSFSPVVPSVNAFKLRAETNIQMQVLLQEYNSAYEHWGFKDPRTCLTLGVWLDAMASIGISKEEICVLIPCRPVTDIVASMKARGNKEQQPGQFNDLAIAYHKRLMEACGIWVNFKTIEFKKLIHEPDILALELTAFIGCPITDTSFIEPELADRHKKDRPMVMGSKAKMGSGKMGGAHG